MNVLVYAHPEDTRDRRRYRQWLEALVNSPSAHGLSDLVLSGFLRIVTHPRVSKEPTQPGTALAFVSEIRGRPNRVSVSPSPRHWEVFTGLVREAGARGNLVPDAFLAALAIASVCQWITTDRDYARLEALRWRRPLH